MSCGQRIQQAVGALGYGAVGKYRPMKKQMILKKKKEAHAGYGERDLRT
jgi:hypothetical protein